MKKIFDEQLMNANRKADARYADMCQSFNDEVERYNQCFADGQKDMLYWKNMFVDLDAKFKEFTEKSERYIKERDEKLRQLEAEAADMAYKYENHGKIYKEEKERADNYEKLYTELKEPYDAIKKEAHRLKLILVRYEEKYAFIDIGALQERVAKHENLYEAAKKESAGYHRDLLEIRKRIMEATQKHERDKVTSGGKKKKKKRNQQDDEQWKGSEDVEKLAKQFTDYLTSPSNFIQQAADAAEAENAAAAGNSP